MDWQVLSRFRGHSGTALPARAFAVQLQEDPLPREHPKDAVAPQSGNGGVRLWRDLCLTLRIEMGQTLRPGILGSPEIIGKQKRSCTMLPWPAESQSPADYSQATD